MKITFTHGYTVKGPSNGVAGEPNEDVTYREGQTVDVSDDSASHFINRGVAMEAKEYADKQKTDTKTPDKK